jgi:hypothetical protein
MGDMASRRFAAAWTLLMACQPALSPYPEVAAGATASAAVLAKDGPPASSSHPSREAVEVPAPTPLSSPFHVVSTDDELLGDYRLFPAGDMAFLVDRQTIAYQLVGDEVRRDPRFNAGLPRQDWFSIRDASGRWPESFWLAGLDSKGLTRLWRWSGAGWTAQPGTLCGDGYFEGAVQPWSKGRQVKLLQCLGGVHSRFRLLEGPPDQSRDAILSEPSRIAGEKFLGFASGQLVLAGYLSEYFFELPVVESITAGDPTSRLSLLPGAITAGATWRVSALAGRSSSDVYVAYDELRQAPEGEAPKPVAHFAHFDGTAWQALQPPPLPGGIRDLWVQSDGGLFAVDRARSSYRARADDATDSNRVAVEGNGLWTRSLGGEWSRVALPSDLSTNSEVVNVLSFWPRAPGDAWAFVEVLRRHTWQRYLLHTRPGVGSKLD